MQNYVYILDALRTPIGGVNRSLKDFSAAQLGAIVLSQILRRNKIKSVDQVILGNTVSAGCGQNLARQAAFAAGLPETVPAYTLNSVCGAGMQGVISAIQAIKSGDADVIFAGGTESASHTPNIVFDLEEQVQVVGALVYDGLWCAISECHMGELAEGVAQEFKISRNEQDAYVLESHRKAAAAQIQGKLKDEIVPVGNFLDHDERVRKSLNVERLGLLKPAFKDSGTVSAGNSSVPCDGAAGLLVASHAFVQLRKIKPKAKIIGYSSLMVKPQDVFTAGVAVISDVLKKSKLSFKDIDLFEVSEAFGAQAVYTQKKLNITPSKLNVYGGDLAFGHPLGAAGARILVTLTHALKSQNKDLGLAYICYGGGGAMAMVIEKI